jgi:tetratricopeptide (TPR) repeat protein
LQGVLKQEPEFLTGRRLLRRAEVTKQKRAKKGLFKVSTAALSIMKAQRELKRDPKRAVEMIEKVLEDEPCNRQANLVLKQAALAAGWPEIGVFALQTILEEKPRDPKILHELGRLHLTLEQSEEAVAVYDQLSQIDPRDAKALRLGKDAAARASMATGGWARAESYRDLVKDQDVAIALEQQIEEAYRRHEAEPQNVDLARRLGVLYEQNQDIENAVVWFQYAADLTNKTDGSLVRKVSDLRRVRAEAEIAAHEKFLASNGPGEPEYAARTEALALAKKGQAELSIDEARKRSERNPTDLQLRFELGQRLVEAGRPREALPELQRARQNPNARLKSMNLLARCYRELGMLDLAAKQLEEAAKEITAMDAMKKEIVYHLGLVYEQMGEAERSIAAMKLIYEADYGYRDVAARVERSYGRE